ncbi:hypothetical protein [Streptomyces cinnamoneus]|uniref:hypothetical protein n=1 Tax=Streptomyces cinnamoneus TaxID=53446 RepID=UPI001EFC4C21|nr:hypothetical protein [Streptomyces cinnamoneus]
MSEGAGSVGARGQRQGEGHVRGGGFAGWGFEEPGPGLDGLAAVVGGGDTGPAAGQSSAGQSSAGQNSACPGSDFARPALDEQALRRLLHDTVGGLEPSGDALEKLRHAVPVRRTRRRQAVVGAAAVVILGATALPVLIHAATTAGNATEDRPANASSSRQRTHDAAEGRHHDASGDGTDGEETTTGQDGQKDGEKTKGDERKPSGDAHSPSGSATGGTTTPGPTLAAASPTCDRDQLGQGSGSVGAADDHGRVYGVFRVVNVSRTVCTVGGPGEVTARPKGSAESTRVSVVDHTAGDAAAGLPDPATEPSQVILQPGQAYEVKFAWVPAAGGGPSGCAKPAPATPAPLASPSAAPGSGTAAAGGKPQANAPAPSSPPASVVLSHTPDVGEPKAVDTTIPNACAGTIYRTGPLATTTPTS